MQNHLFHIILSQLIFHSDSLILSIIYID